VAGGWTQRRSRHFRIETTHSGEKQAAYIATPKSTVVATEGAHWGKFWSTARAVRLPRRE
jgi:hypothetical protein